MVAEETKIPSVSSQREEVLDFEDGIHLLQGSVPPPPPGPISHLPGCQGARRWDLMSHPIPSTLAAHHTPMQLGLRKGPWGGPCPLTTAQENL